MFLFCMLFATFLISLLLYFLVEIVRIIPGGKKSRVAKKIAVTSAQGNHLYFIVCFFVHRQVLFITKLLYFTKVALYLVFLSFNLYNKLSGSFLQNEERRRPEEGRT